MEVPGHVTFLNGRAGSFQFGLLQAQMDCNVRAASMPPRIEFTWPGFDEGDKVTGRGYAEVVDGKLDAHLYIHLGDDSAFRAVRQTVTARKRKRT